MRPSSVQTQGAPPPPPSAHANVCAGPPTEAEAYPNTRLNFEHKLQDWSAETGLMTFARYTHLVLVTQLVTVVKPEARGPGVVRSPIYSGPQPHNRFSKSQRRLSA